MKRFTETTKWSDPWFRSLSPQHKCLWNYLCDACDNAGVIRIDWALASFLIGAPVSEADLKHFDGRIEQIAGGYCWLTKFVAFQYRTLTQSNPATRQVLDLLSQHGLVDKANGARRKTQQVGPTKGLGRSMEGS